MCRYLDVVILYSKVFDGQSFTPKLASDFGNKTLRIAFLKKIAYTYTFERSLFDFSFVYGKQQPLVLLCDVAECNSTITAKDNRIAQIQ